MKINVNNTDQIKSALFESAGKALGHTITNEHFPSKLARDVDIKLLSEGVLKKHLVGCRVRFSQGGPAASSYNYKVISSWLEIERFESGWFMTEIHRYDAWPKEKGSEKIYITESARDDILSKYTIIAASCRVDVRPETCLPFEQDMVEAVDAELIGAA